MDKRGKGQKIIYGYIHGDLLKLLRIVAPDFYGLRVRKFSASVVFRRPKTRGRIAPSLSCNLPRHSHSLVSAKLNPFRVDPCFWR